MKKKEYIKPELNVYQMETLTMLANSNVKIAEDDDYGDENVGNIVDGFGNISED